MQETYSAYIVGHYFSVVQEGSFFIECNEGSHSPMTLEVKPNGYGASFQVHMPAEGKDNLLTNNLKMTFPPSLSCIYSASDLAQFL